MVDVAIGTDGAESGWTAGAGDKTLTAPDTSPVDATTFKLVSSSEAANVITTLPEGYPTVDFYGSAITASAAAGAVQATE